MSKKKYATVTVVVVIIIFLMASILVCKKKETEFYEYDARKYQQIPETHLVCMDKNDDAGALYFLFYDSSKEHFAQSLYVDDGLLLKDFVLGGSPLVDEINPYHVEAFDKYTIFAYNGDGTLKTLTVINKIGEVKETYSLGDKPLGKVFSNDEFSELVIE